MPKPKQLTEDTVAEALRTVQAAMMQHPVPHGIEYRCLIVHRSFFRLVRSNDVCGITDVHGSFNESEMAEIVLHNKVS